MDILLGYGKGAACDKERAHTYQCDKPYRIFGNACADRHMHNKDDIHVRQKRYRRRACTADNSKGQSDFYNVPVHDCLPVYFSYDFVFRYFMKI